MSAANFTEALAEVLKSEGGWSDNAHDPGGATNRGITFNTLKSWMAQYNQPTPSIEDLRNITEEQVAAIYRKRYWDVIAGDALPPGLDYSVFDFAVNSGPRRATEVLQRNLAVNISGAVDRLTVYAANTAEVPALILNYNTDRLLFLRSLPTWSNFGRGWQARVNHVLTVSDAMFETGATP